MKRIHHICEFCAKRSKGVFELEPIFWGNCCWCGESTGGLYKEAEKAPCDDTCVSEWMREKTPSG